MARAARAVLFFFLIQPIMLLNCGVVVAITKTNPIAETQCLNMLLVLKMRPTEYYSTQDK